MILKTQTTSKQGIRLKEFIDYLELSLDGFRKQCQIRSTNTIPDIINKGKSPTQKVLFKIISRYPQLNKDWMELGIGMMILPQFQNNQISNSAHSASQNSQYNKINTSLINHDFALNEVVLRLQKAIVTQNEHTLLLSTKIEKLNQMSIQRWKELEEVLDQENKNRIDQIKKFDINRRQYFTDEMYNLKAQSLREIKLLFDNILHEIKSNFSNKIGEHSKNSKTRL